jgi:hypothetical protein
MKSIGKCLLLAALLAMLAACGKQNTSGKTNSWSYGNPYTYPGVNMNSLGAVNSPVALVNQIMQSYPCQSNPQNPMGRIPLQVPLTNFKSQVAPNDFFVGVTSVGDVAIVIGTALGQPPMFLGYMCPRSFAQSGSGQLTGVEINANMTRCTVKTLSARIVFPGGSEANIRAMDAGMYMTGQPFTGICH